MKLKETTIEHARYGEIALGLWGECEVLGGRIRAYYQGEIILALRDPSGTVRLLEYDYGS